MTKSECREIFSEKRKLLTEEQINFLSLQIIDRTLQNVNLSEKVISLYFPIAQKKEINTWLLFNRDTLSSVTFVSTISDFTTSLLRHIAIDHSTNFAINSWGIPEPVWGEKIKDTDIDIVIVPLLAFDFRGYRVGYGKGFYDRFLINCRKDCLFLGLSFFEPIDHISDINTYDIPLHICITPNKVWNFNV